VGYSSADAITSHRRRSIPRRDLAKGLPFAVEYPDAAIAAIGHLETWFAASRAMPGSVLNWHIQSYSRDATNCNL
jgi:hypothetical protein